MSKNLATKSVAGVLAFFAFVILGVGDAFGVLLTLLFTGLKLGEVGTVAAWSWAQVTAPFWLPIAVGLPLLILAGIAALVAAVRS